MMHELAWALVVLLTSAIVMLLTLGIGRGWVALMTWALRS